MINTYETMSYVYHLVNGQKKGQWVLAIDAETLFPPHPHPNLRSHFKITFFSGVEGFSPMLTSRTNALSLEDSPVAGSVFSGFFLAGVLSGELLFLSVRSIKRQNWSSVICPPLSLSQSFL